MLEALNSLCGAGEAAGTSSDGLVFFADGMGTAFRAKVRKFEFDRIRRTFFFDNLNNLRDYVTGALDYNRIANADVFAPDFVFIMQRGVRNDDTADIYRFQVGYRCQSTGPPDLDADVVDSGDGLFGRGICGRLPNAASESKSPAVPAGQWS